MQPVRYLQCVLLLAGAAACARSDIIVDYTLDAGGDNHQPLNGLAARGTFHGEGAYLSILLENTSSGVPQGFDAADSLLVSLGINLPGADILSGDAATIGPGARGLGSWSDRTAGDSVAEEWLWTNEFGGDLMEAYKHVISTSNGQGGGPKTRFDGGSGGVDGPWGGIAADPPIIDIPARKPAASDSILFELALTAPLTQAELRAAANQSIVEFGSDARYLRVPEPTAAGPLLLGGLLTFSRRRRA